MDKKFKLLIAGMVICLSLPLADGFAGDDASLFQKGLSAARGSQADFAFSYFDMIVKNHSGSVYYPQALFATGEYYFLSSVFRDAKLSFLTLVEQYPDSELRPFALAYLLHMTKRDGDPLKAKEIEKEIVKTRQVSLVFRDFKEYEFTSPLNRIYKAQFFIDKVEVYVNGQLFEEIPF